MTFTSAALYLRDIAGFVPLTPDDETALAQRIEAGCEEARQIMIEHNLRLVVTVARRFEVPTMPLTDLIEEGNLGLMKAVERFDWRRGFRFSTVAVPWIESAINEAIANKARAVRVPIATMKQLRARDGVGPRFVSLDGFAADGAADDNPLEIADDAPSAATLAGMQDTRTRLKAALATLSRRERILLIRRYHLPEKEYADA